MRLIGNVLALVAAVFAAMIGAGLGVGLMLKLRARPAGEVARDEVELVAIFGSQDTTISGEVFAGGSILTYMGGVALDVREATIPPEGATIRIRTVFGGVRIMVPEGCRVELQGKTLMGGNVDNTTDQNFADDAPVIRIFADTTFGGVTVTFDEDDDWA